MDSSWLQFTHGGFEYSGLKVQSDFVWSHSTIYFFTDLVQFLELVGVVNLSL